MNVNLDKLEQLAKTATPTDGTYHNRGCDDLGFSLFGVDEGSRGSFDRREDAAYYAAANPQTMLALIARIRELDAKLDHLCNYDRMDEFTPEEANQ